MGRPNRSTAVSYTKALPAIYLAVEPISMFLQTLPQSSSRCAS